MGRVYASKRGGRAVPAKRSGGVLRTLLLVALPLALGVGWLGLFTAGAGAQGVSVEVSQCDENSPDQNQPECQESSQQVGVDKGSSSKKRKPSSQQSSASVPQGQSAPAADKTGKKRNETHT